MAGGRYIGSSSTKQDLISDLEQIKRVHIQLAGADPVKIRNLIPDTEVWRVFVGGAQQAAGQGLKKNACFQEQTPKTSVLFGKKSSLEISVAKYIENQTVESGTKLLSEILEEHFWTLTEKEKQKLKLKNLLELDQAWTAFKRNEPGYFKSAYTAFSEIFNMQDPLDLNYIKVLHALATKDVQGTHYDNSTEKKGGFREQRAVGFPITLASTVDGLAEILKSKEDYYQLKVDFGKEEVIEIILNNNFFKALNKDLMPILNMSNETERKGEAFRKFFNFCIFKEAPSDIQISATNIFIEYLRSHGSEQKDIFSKLIFSLFMLHDEKEAAESIFDFMQKSATKQIHFSSVFKSSAVKKEIEDELNRLLGEYATSLKLAKNDYEKLRAIVVFIKKAELLQPFYDANCRTLCILLLNRELMRNGFPLAILSNPNYFKDHSTEELIKKVIQGMQNTFILIQEKKLFNISTPAFLDILKSKRSYASYLKDFNEMVAIEKENRKKMSQPMTSQTTSSSSKPSGYSRMP